MDESLIQKLAQSIGESMAKSVSSSNDQVIQSLTTINKTLAKSIAANMASHKLQKSNFQKQNGLLNQLLGHLSIALPGGGRLFGIGKIINTFRTATGVVGKFLGGLTLVITALGGLTETLYQFAQQLGGVNLTQAAKEIVSITWTSIKSLLSGQFINPFRTLQIKGAFAREFGGLLSSDDAKELQLITQRLGIGVQELITLERTLQSTGFDLESTINEFRKVGIVSKVATSELNKSAIAVARSGQNFNKYIRDSIVDATRLGLSFSEIDKTLTGFSNDFEGTVTKFSQLRAIIPGFQVDFNQLFTTALYGTTEEYTDLIRQGLLDAGITSTQGMSRLMTQQLELSTGFSADQINRILVNEKITANVAESLDTERNNILRSITGLLTMIVTLMTIPTFNVLKNGA
jgi:hypothetical protein